jgi:hypothetical protein
MAADFNRWYRPSSDAGEEGGGRRRVPGEDQAHFELSCSVGRADLPACEVLEPVGERDRLLRSGGEEEA